ncbi:MAG: hydantoinase B/oxoprolinase family protein [Dehalococcoidia bacterium]|nr:hydantoinase B/oxoprolinase family protein [Dehalococcoidia bacterium]
MGLCYQGKTLKKVVEERDELFKKTGYCYGLEKLELIENDPARFMRFQMKLVAACVSCRETARLITANPAAVVMGELVFMLATAEGDCVAASYGLVGHVQSFPFFIDSIAKLGFEDNPGVRKGDLFFCNDPYYGAPHHNDCYTWVPIFHEGELIAWSAGCNHILDVGSFQTGGLGTITFDTFTDGFTCPPLKTGEDFLQHRWWDLFWQRRTRMGTLNILDDKMRVAGSVGLHDKILEVVEEFGVDYFREGLHEILERERRVQLQRIKNQAIPGKYQYRYFSTVRYKGIGGALFPNSNKDWMLQLPAEVLIRPNATISIDVEGMSSEDSFYANSYKPAILMVSSLGPWPMFAYSLTLNTSLLYVTDWNIPPGTLGNPQNPYQATTLLEAPAKYLFMFRDVFSRAYFSRGFLEECFPGGATGAIYGQAGVFADGFRWGAGDWSLMGAEASAATPYKDGEVVSCSGPNPQSDMGEVEACEFMIPTNLHLGKKLIPNYCGHGKFRGGLGSGQTFLIVDPGQNLNVNLYMITHGTGHCCSGMSGGYLAPNAAGVFVHDTNMREILANGGTYPRDIVEIREWLKDGRLKAGRVAVYDHPTPNIPVKDGDLFAIAAGAKGGWGDPLEREMSLLENDVRYGWLSPDVVESVYGAVIDEKGKVKANESAKLRQQMRSRRKERSVLVKDWWHQEREKVLNKELPELVRNMYGDCLKYGKFRREFTQMWHLPEEYQI